MQSLVVPNFMVPENFFEITSEDGDLLANSLDNTCNTRKSRDKRVLRHTVGILIGSFPCGTVTLFDELYGSESLSQVYGIVIDYISKLPQESPDKLEEFVYDDACHMTKFAANPKRANHNDTTKKFDSMGKHVDNFHFRNHTDKWCQENCNPKDVSILQNVNTPVCEQLFSKFNKFTNVKAMNEAKFSFHFLYNLESHNLNIEGKLRSLANPTSEYRLQFVKSAEKRQNEKPDDIANEFSENTEVQFDETESCESPEDIIEEVITSVERMGIDELKCKICGAEYKKIGYLKTHMTKKHGTKTTLQCETCQENFDSKRSLERHIQTEHVFACSECKETFTSKSNLDTHLLNHFSCNICNKAFDKKWKLTKHAKCHD